MMLTVDLGLIDAERSVRQDHIVVLKKHDKISFKEIVFAWKHAICMALVSYQF